MTVNDQGLLNQILDTLNKFGERLAVVESDLKTVIRDHTKDLDDHESRIRGLEADNRDHVTKADLLAADLRREELVATALAESDRKANRRIAVGAVAISATVAVVNVGIALIR